MGKTQQYERMMEDCEDPKPRTIHVTSSTNHVNLLLMLLMGLVIVMLLWNHVYEVNGALDRVHEELQQCEAEIERVTSENNLIRQELEKIGQLVREMGQVKKWRNEHSQGRHQSESVDEVGNGSENTANKTSPLATEHQTSSSGVYPEFDHLPHIGRRKQEFVAIRLDPTLSRARRSVIPSESGQEEIKEGHLELEGGQGELEGGQGELGGGQGELGGGQVELKDKRGENDTISDAVDVDQGTLSRHKRGSRRNEAVHLYPKRYPNATMEKVTTDGK